MYQPPSAKKDKPSLGGIDFKFTKIRYETEKALLIENGEEVFWIAKSRVVSVNEIDSLIMCMYGTTTIAVSK